MLDRLPAWLRHLLIASFAVFGGAITKDIILANGVTEVDWSEALRAALNATAVSDAITAGALWFTPLTEQYGVGSTSEVKDDQVVVDEGVIGDVDPSI